MAAQGCGLLGVSGLAMLVGLASCGSSPENGVDFPKPIDPDKAPVAEVDRFSEAAGTMFVRNRDIVLPAAGEPIDFDQAPFVTLGLGPAGEHVRYYHFDVRDQRPAPMYVVTREDTGKAVSAQLPIVDVLPGHDGYNDFFRIYEVKVPASYQANSLTSLQQIRSLDLEVAETDEIVNRPIVPGGSSAVRRLPGQDATLRRVWYRGSIGFTFTFEDPTRTSTSFDGDLIVALAEIYVTFNVNPDQPEGGPCSGFMTEPGTEQTHNVVAVLPPDPEYSPLWNVFAYDNADFGTVHDLDSAEAATIVPGVEAPIVNCPIVEIQP